MGREYVAMSLKAHPTYLPALTMMQEMNQNGVMQAGHTQPAVQVGGVE